MNLHWLQHVPFEGLGYIADWAEQRNAEITQTRLYAGDALPDPAAPDLLVIMGGPMGIHDEAEYPWLADEKSFIHEAIQASTPTLGICLGAQLLAHVLGARVYPGPQKEIGWFPIQRTAHAPDWLPEEQTVFHWHGDTFDLPEQAVPLASSSICNNQGFIYRDRIIGLQFHLETTPQSMEALIEHCGDELTEQTDFTQSPAAMRKAAMKHLPQVHALLERLLDRMLS